MDRKRFEPEVSTFSSDAELAPFDRQLNPQFEVLHPVSERATDPGLEARVLGPRPIQGDFEGLAWDGARFHLVTSTGTLLSFEPGTDEMVTDYAARATRAGDWCEVEGLAFDPRVGALIMACKTVLRGDQRGLTLLLAVAVPGPDTVEAAPPLPVTVALSLDEATLDALDLPSPLRLSGVALHPLRDQWVLVSAQQARVIEVARDGAVVASVRLRSGRHPQTEGLELDPTGEVLFLADEGAGGRGRVTTYRADGGQP